MNGRPVYAHTGAGMRDCRMFYGASGNWCVGNEASAIDGQGKGWWTVRSDAPTPDLIRETWKCFSGDARTVAAAAAMNGAAQQPGLAALGLGQGWVDATFVKALAVSEAEAAATEVTAQLSKHANAASMATRRAQEVLHSAQAAEQQAMREVTEAERRLAQARADAASAVRQLEDAAMRERSSQAMRQQAEALTRAIAAVLRKPEQTSSAHPAAAAEDTTNTFRGVSSCTNPTGGGGKMWRAQIQHNGKFAFCTANLLRLWLHH